MSGWVTTEAWTNNILQVSLQAVPQKTVGFSQNNTLLLVYGNVALWLTDKRLIGFFFMVRILVISREYFCIWKSAN